MENSGMKKVKMADEKFCSECGEIIKRNAEICPKCGVSQVPISDVTASTKYKCDNQGEKFLFSGGATLVAFLILIFLVTPEGESLRNGIIGSFILALMSGLLGMVIPTIKKIIYIPVSLVAMCLLAFIIGLLV